jgi:hypothetical protein
MIALTEKPKATKHSDYSTISLVTNTAKVAVRALRRTERKIEDVLGKIQFGFRRRKGTRDAENNIRTNCGHR